jgi:hypothetical protein
LSGKYEPGKIDEVLFGVADHIKIRSSVRRNFASGSPEIDEWVSMRSARNRIGDHIGATLIVVAARLPTLTAGIRASVG